MVPFGTISEIHRRTLRLLPARISGFSCAISGERVMNSVSQDMFNRLYPGSSGVGSVWWQPPLNDMVSPVHLYMNTICTNNTFTQKCQFRLRGAPQTLLPITPGFPSNPALHPLKRGLWHAHLCPSCREAWV